MNSMTKNNIRCPGITAPATHDISTRSRLSRDEERKLAGMIATGDRDARDRLVLANLGLVVVIARDFHGQGLDSDDLISEGNLGLFRAAEKFDPNFGIPFGNYAQYWIKAKIRTALINTAHTIRVPAHTFKLLLKCRRAESTLCGEWGRVPKFEDVTSILNLSPDQKLMVAQAQAAYQLRPKGGATGESGPQWAEELSDADSSRDNMVDSEDERRAALVRMACLEDRERNVVTLRFGVEGECLTLEAIGRRLGLTRERVRQIEMRAIQKLRDDHGPRSFDSNAASRLPVSRRREVSWRS